MSKLFDKDEQYTPEARMFAGDIQDELNRIYRRAIDSGYSVRETHYLIESVSTEIHLAHVTGWDKIKS